jgi:hypothetical protein
LSNPQDTLQPWWLDVQRMRRYIRHPSGVPLKFAVADGVGQKNAVDEGEALGVRDVSEGGLCFSSDHPVQIGSHITIQIPIGSPPFEAKGVVAWCHEENEVIERGEDSGFPRIDNGYDGGGNRYAVGVQFEDYVTRFSVRMVEQVCHIEHYREDMRKLEGRDLSIEEAAQEWIDRYAGNFPGCYG